MFSSTQYNDPEEYLSSYFKLYNMGVRYCEKKKTIILSYDDEEHFRLIGYYSNNNMKTLFNHKTLPEEVKNIIKIDLMS